MTHICPWNALSTGDFLVPRELLGQEQERPIMDIAVANPRDLIKYLHRLFDVLLKVRTSAVEVLPSVNLEECISFAS